MRILIVEDEERLAARLAEGLCDQGLAVDISHDCGDAPYKIDTNAGTANATKLQLWACSGAGNQQWSLRS
ncbi:hypothetical protein [Kitasatospora mediocidica]|uniref:hypothetical protein n=1 Tax=Kitasatospora mediocidica TaxID=58352 RepID=UPI000565D9FF